jgi:hypothetical protein
MANKRISQKAQQREMILMHGFKLIRVFNLPPETPPVTLCKKVHRLEVEAHNLAERQCGEWAMEEEQWDKKKGSILKRLDAILHFTSQGIPVFINGDPRGYALKIDDTWVKEHGLGIHRDWGGYGIIAPEF